MRHYLAVLVLQREAGWRVHFPDFPGCRAEGATVAEAINASSSAAAEQAQLLKAKRMPLPLARTYEEVRHHSDGWASERGIDWSNAVVSLVPVSIFDE